MQKIKRSRRREDRRGGEESLKRVKKRKYKEKDKKTHQICQNAKIGERERRGGEGNH